jgi:hypothetical protein
MEPMRMGLGRERSVSTVTAGWSGPRGCVLDGMPMMTLLQNAASV